MSFRGWERDIGISASLIELINLAKNAGFKGIEINIKEVASLAEDKGIGYVKRLFDDNGIQPAGWPLSMVDWDEDDEVFQRGLEQLSRLADVGQQLGSTRVVSGVAPYSDERPFRENLDWHAARLRPVAKVLKENGCRIGLEYIGSKLLRSGHKWEFIHDIKSGLELCRAIGLGNVGLLLDSFHWYTAQESLGDIRRLSAEEVVYVHLCDAPRDVPFEELGHGPRELPGETGIIDLTGFLRTLREIDYDGPVMAEPDHRFSDEVRRLSARNAAQVIYEALDRLWRESRL